MIKYIILGIIQGFTEFLPVSSSAHLAIMQRVLGMRGEEVAISVVLHLGTLVAVVAFFFKDILRLLRDLKTISLVLSVTLITGVIGVIGKDFFESLFTSPKLIAIALVVTGIILISTRKFAEPDKAEVSFKDALILGFTQGIAIIPGISRSGITISTLLFRGIGRQACFRFSFLVSIPIILGAALLESRKIDFAIQHDFVNLLAGFIFSLFCGLAALSILKAVIQRAKLYYFGYYCFAVALVTLLFVK